VSIIANHIITTDPTPDQAASDAQLVELGELQHSQTGR
jgi:hypothetical protein